MAKKKSERYYFDNFIACTNCARKAAAMLDEILGGFDVKSLPDKIEQMHAIEHEADTYKHEMMEELVRAFITPIEREDIILLSQNIDEVIDCIEDVLLRIYINNVKTISPELLQFSKLLIRSCDAMQQLLEAFPEFKRGSGMHQLIIEINALEEEGDRLFISSMRKLHTESTDPIEIIAWREIYIYVEKCVDACEHVADVVESIIMKNT